MRAAGFVLVTSALGLLGSQLVQLTPWHFGVGIAIAALVFGGLLLADHPRRQRARRVARRRRARTGYLDLTQRPGSRLP